MSRYGMFQTCNDLKMYIFSKNKISFSYILTMKTLGKNMWQNVLGLYKIMKETPAVFMSKMTITIILLNNLPPKNDKIA